MRHVVAVLLVLMHAVAGRAAGSVVCLGGACAGQGEIAVSVSRLGDGHEHDHDHDHDHDHNHGPAADGWRSEAPGCSHGVGLTVHHEHGNGGAPADGDGGDECACIDVWMPDGKVEDGRGPVGGADVAALVLKRVERAVGGVVERRVERLADQWPPGVDPGIRCTVLLI